MDRHTFSLSIERTGGTRGLEHTRLGTDGHPVSKDRTDPWESARTKRTFYGCPRVQTFDLKIKENNVKDKVHKNFMDLKRCNMDF